MLKIDDFLAHLNRRGTLNPVSENTKKAYRNSLEQFQRFLDGRQPTQELAQEWIQQLLDRSLLAAGFLLLWNNIQLLATNIARGGPIFGDIWATKRRRTKKDRISPKGTLASKQGLGN